jgi:hypothetical protein
MFEAFENTEDDKHTEALLKLLDRLNVKSAGVQIERIMANNVFSSMTNNFGAPDQIFMDPITLAALQQALGSNPKLQKK